MPARKSKKYEKNPFIDELIEESQTTQKTITSPFNKNANLTVVDTDTGEIQTKARAAIQQYHIVEKNEFVKIYTKGIARIFGLNRAGQRVFALLFDQISGSKGIQKDIVTMYYPGLSDSVKEILSYRVFTNGINDLIKQGFIAETILPHQYYINPCYLFNGDRLAMMDVYITKEAAEQERLMEERRLNEKNITPKEEEPKQLTTWVGDGPMALK